MSLAVLATQMATKGRYGDDMLVHMSKEEVQHLQNLAKAHGTTLTINPETGLPEAFSLGKLLGVLAPFALNLLVPGLGAAVGGALGTSSAVGSALVTGGIGALSTGSLEKGLMMGLGAYGLSGVGGALGSMGSDVAAQGMSAANAATGAGLQTAADQAIQGIAQAAQPSAASIGAQFPVGDPGAGFMPNIPTPPLVAPPMPTYTPNPQDIRFAQMGQTPAPEVTKALESPIKTGINQLTQPGGFGKFVSAMGGPKNTLMAAGALAAPFLLSDGKTQVRQDSVGNIAYYDYDPLTQQSRYMGSVPATEVNKAGGYEAGKALLGRAQGGLARLAAGGAARFAEGGDADEEPKPYNVPRETGFVPLFGAPPSVNPPAPAPDSGPFVAGPYEPGYVEPPYDPSTDAGNWFENPPAGETFEKFKPGQETDQDYYARLREYYASPEGQAYTQKQEADRLAAVEAIRAQYFGSGVTTGPGAPAPGAPAPTPGAPAPAPGGAPTPAAPTPGAPTPVAPAPGAPAPIPSTPGLPPVSPPPYTGGEGVIGSPDLITRAYQDFWVGTPVGSEISWAGGKLKRIGAAQAVFTGPDGKTMTLAPGSDLNSIAANNPNIGELWRQEFGLVPKNYMTGSSYDAYEYLMGRGKYPTIQRGIIQDEYAPLAFGEDVAKYRGKYRPNYETGKMELNPAYKEPKFPGLPGGTPNPNAPAGMQDAYDSYWATNKVGTEIPFAGGKLKRVSENSAVFTAKDGAVTYLSPGSSFADIATAAPDIADLWKTQFGYTLPAAAPAPIDNSGTGGDSGGGGGGGGGSTTGDPADAPGNYAYGGMLRRNTGGIVALAGGGYNLGDYSDGGRLLKGPGDGVSDSIPATIGNRRPARLADGEFVVPARIVSELGNGSTNAGAKKLYAMMDRIQARRSKTTGKGRVAVNSRADKVLPA